MDRRAGRTICLLGGVAVAFLSSNGLASPQNGTARWSDADCVAYSRQTRRYACFDASLGADAGVPGLRDFEAVTPPDSAWCGHKALVLVAEQNEIISISQKEYDWTKQIVRSRSTRQAVRLARDRGYARRLLAKRALPAGQWQSFHNVWLRFDTRLREGEASFANHGSLRLSCEKPLSNDGGKVVADNQAERASAFAAFGADTIVIGFVEVEGGEGAAYFNTNYVWIDLRAHCKKSGD
jgi:hypothetical protein